MGLGNWGTILIVIAVLWGAWTFFLSPNAGINKDIVGGFSDIITGNDIALEDKAKKYGPALKQATNKIEARCPGCSKSKSEACGKCIQNLANDRAFGEDIVASFRNPGAGGGTSQIKKASYAYGY